MANINGGITLDVALEQLNLAIAALANERQKLSSGIHLRGTASLLESLRQDVMFWRQEVARLQRGNSGPSIRLGVAL